MTKFQALKEAPFFDDKAVLGLVRLRTLITIRWLAAGGQSLTLLIVHFVLGYELLILPAFAVVAMSAVFNGFLSWRPPERPWLNDREARTHLCFDILQLFLLLYFTGGIDNPFILLILAPVTLTATTLSLVSTAMLGSLTVICVSALTLTHYPLPLGGVDLELPTAYVFGMWGAIVMTVVLLAAYNWTLAESARRMSGALREAQLTLERDRRLSALGGLAAAIAHELGTPLATITVVAKEIAKDTPRDCPLWEDISLLISQCDRCRDILAELSERPDEKHKKHINPVPVSALVEKAASPYQQGPIKVRLAKYDESTPGKPAHRKEPFVPQLPEFVHGIGGFVQNAVQFASSRVDIALGWDDDHIWIEISDDGPGFPSGILHRLGDPYLSTRVGESGHMGLGVFISQSLLVRTGAVVSFVNRKNGGAKVKVRWPRNKLEA